MTESDDVNHPKHYTSHPSGIECIEISEELPANLAAAFQYIWRDGIKEAAPLKDLRKAEWYLAREAARCRKRISARGRIELLKQVEKTDKGLLGHVASYLHSCGMRNMPMSIGGEPDEGYVSAVDSMLVLVREEIARRMLKQSVVPLMVDGVLISKQISKTEHYCPDHLEQCR